jgi:hypothetical protein
VAAQALPCARTSGHITASHIAAVTFLNVDKQRQWLERAEHENLSVRQLKERIRHERHEAGEGRGRAPVAVQRRVVSGVRNAVAALRRAVDALSGMDLDPNDTRELVALADQVALLQAELRFHKGPALSNPCAGPKALAKVEEEASFISDLDSTGVTGVRRSAG